MRPPRRKLHDYIQKSLKYGMEPQEIRRILVKQGWKESQVNRGMKQSAKRFQSFDWKLFFARLLGLGLIAVLYFWFSGLFMFSPTPFFNPSHTYGKAVQNFSQNQEVNGLFSVVYTDSEKYASVTTAQGQYRFDSSGTVTVTFQSLIKIGDQNYSGEHVLTNIVGKGLFLKNTFTDIDESVKVLNVPIISLDGIPLKLSSTAVEGLSKEAIVRKVNSIEWSRLPHLVHRENVWGWEYTGRGQGMDTHIGFSLVKFKPLYLNLLIPVPSAGEATERLSQNISDDKADTKKNDAERLAAIQEITNELERFYNKNKGYPEGINGQPKLTDGFVWPVPPPGTVNCSGFYNTYWYQHVGQKQGISKDAITLYDSYKVTFCLDSPTGNINAGVADLTPAGISSKPCEFEDPLCAIPEQSVKNTLLSPGFFETLPTNAKLELTLYPPY